MEHYNTVEFLITFKIKLLSVNNMHAKRHNLSEPLIMTLMLILCLWENIADPNEKHPNNETVYLGSMSSDLEP